MLMTPARSVLTAMLLAVGGLPNPPASTSTESFTSAQEYDKFYHGLDKVNLHEGLSAGTHPSASTSTSYSQSIVLSFSNALLSLALPSTRNRCQDMQARPCPPSLSAAHCRPILHDVNPHHPRHAPQIVSLHSSRTLSVVFCFRVRMHTMFVSYILFDVRCIRSYS